MLRRRAFPLCLACVPLLLASAAGGARADDPVLVGTVGLNDSFTINLADASGQKVYLLRPGTYTILVHDYSMVHNFRWPRTPT